MDFRRRPTDHLKRDIGRDPGNLIRCAKVTFSAACSEGSFRVCSYRLTPPGGSLESIRTRTGLVTALQIHSIE